jgi:hypothetical protein
MVRNKTLETYQPGAIAEKSSSVLLFPAPPVSEEASVLIRFGQMAPNLFFYPVTDE